MKAVIFLVLFFFSRAPTLPAQSNQISLYIQQMAANQVMIGYIREGFKIAKFGLTTIGDLKQGEFHLHRDFFQSLSAVNPRLKKIAQVADIIAMQVQVLKNCSMLLQRIRQRQDLTASELQYWEEVINRLHTDTGNILNEFLTLVTDGQYQMSDDERIQRMQDLYREMKRSLQFYQQLNDEVLLINRGRQKFRKEIEAMKKMYK